MTDGSAQPQRSLAFGRQEAIESVLRSTSRVTLIVGDSGVGKSEVLRQVQLSDEHAVSPTPTSLRNAPGALQRALLEALGNTVANIEEDESLFERLGGLVVAAAKRMAILRADELAGAVGRQLLGLIRNRVSQEAASLLAGFAQQLTTAASQELASRITAASDPDVLDIITSFAQDVVALADGRPLHLALDDGDRLEDDDLRRLMDFAETLPDGITLRIAFATWDAGSRDRANAVRMAGAYQVELEGLRVEAIAAWMGAEGLGTALANGVLSATDGYALYVADAIELLKVKPGPHTLADLKPRGVLEAQTERAWNGLDIFTQVAAARLAAFQNPLSQGDAAELLGLDVGVWGSIESRLRVARIFTGLPPWFHQLRRQCLWAQLLTEGQRDDARNRALSYLRARMELPPISAQPEVFVEFARLLPAMSDVLSENPMLAASVSANPDEIAILASIVELESSQSNTFSADVLLRYAYQIFGPRDNLAAAVHSLAERSLIHLSSTQSDTIVVPLFDSGDVKNLISGRAAKELGRLPVAGLATTVFQRQIGAALGEIRGAHFGIGAPGADLLSRMAVHAQRRRPDGTMDVSRRGPNLLLRVQYGEVPLYAAVAYDSHQDRDDAAQRLQGFTGSLRDVPLVVANVVNQPTPSVPSLRFMRAAELISGRDLLGPGGPNAVPRMEAPLLLDEEMRRRAALLEYVRNASDKTERLAYRLEEPTGYIYFGDEQDFESARVIGRPGSERLTHRPNSALFSAFHRLDLVQLARLRQGEQLGLVSVHGGRLNEPVLAELSSLKGQALAFNREQDRRIVSLKEDDLQASLEEALRRVRHDAQSLAAAVQIEGSVDPTERLRPRTTCVAVVVGERVPGVVWPMQATVLTLANEPAEDVALVRIVPAEWMEPLSSGSTWDDHARELAGWFDLELQPGWETIEGDGRQILAALLGHVESEIGFA